MATKTLLTLDDFAKLPDEPDKTHELSEGELITVTRPKLRHTRLVSRIHYKLAQFAVPRDLGELHIEGGFLLSTDPPTLRSPDLAFVSKSHLANQNPDGWFEGAPEIAIEVVSPSETAADIEKKTRQYLAADAQLVWIIYPETETVHVFGPEGAHRVLTAADTLEAPDLLPGWSAPVAELLA